jgi:hypothetical protein
VGLLGVALLAVWLVAAILSALLGQPTETLALWQARGTRAMPAVVWAGSRELMSRFRTESETLGHD